VENDLVRGLGLQPLDVRSAQEYGQDHLEATMNIPLPWLLRHTGELSRDEPLAVLCASGYPKLNRDQSP